MSDVKAPVAVAAYADGKDIPRESSTENKITRSFVRLGYHDYPKELVEREHSVANVLLMQKKKARICAEFARLESQPLRRASKRRRVELKFRSMSQGEESMFFSKLEDPSVPFDALAEDIPEGITKNTKKLLDGICCRNIPLARSTWIVKVVFVNNEDRKKANPSESSTNRSMRGRSKKNTQSEIRRREWTSRMMEYAERLLFSQTKGNSVFSRDVTTKTPREKKWAAFSRLLLWQLEEGLLDRPQVINQLLDAMSNYSTASSHQARASPLSPSFHSSPFRSESGPTGSLIQLPPPTCLRLALPLAAAVLPEASLSSLLSARIWRICREISARYSGGASGGGTSSRTTPLASISNGILSYLSTIYPPSFTAFWDTNGDAPLPLSFQQGQGGEGLRSGAMGEEFVIMVDQAKMLELLDHSVRDIMHKTGKKFTGNFAPLLRQPPPNTPQADKWKACILLLIEWAVSDARAYIPTYHRIATALALLQTYAPNSSLGSTLTNKSQSIPNPSGTLDMLGFQFLSEFKPNSVNELWRVGMIFRELIRFDLFNYSRYFRMLMATGSLGSSCLGGLVTMGEEKLLDEGKEARRARHLWYAQVIPNLARLSSDLKNQRIAYVLGGVHRLESGVIHFAFTQLLSLAPKILSEQVNERDRRVDDRFIEAMERHLPTIDPLSSLAQLFRAFSRANTQRKFYISRGLEQTGALVSTLLPSLAFPPLRSLPLHVRAEVGRRFVSTLKKALYEPSFTSTGNSTRASTSAFFEREALLDLLDSLTTILAASQLAPALLPRLLSCLLTKPPPALQNHPTFPYRIANLVLRYLSLFAFSPKTHPAVLGALGKHIVGVAGATDSHTWAEMVGIPRDLSILDDLRPHIASQVSKRKLHRTHSYKTPKDKNSSPEEEKGIPWEGWLRAFYQAMFDVIKATDKAAIDQILEGKIQALMGSIHFVNSVKTRLAQALACVVMAVSEAGDVFEKAKMPPWLRTHRLSIICGIMCHLRAATAALDHKPHTNNTNGPTPWEIASACLTCECMLGIQPPFTGDWIDAGRVIAQPRLKDLRGTPSQAREDAVLTFMTIALSRNLIPISAVITSLESHISNQTNPTMPVQGLSSKNADSKLYPPTNLPYRLGLVLLTSPYPLTRSSNPEVSGDTEISPLVPGFLARQVGSAARSFCGEDLVKFSLGWGVGEGDVSESESGWGPGGIPQGMICVWELYPEAVCEALGRLNEEKRRRLIAIISKKATTIKSNPNSHPADHAREDRLETNNNTKWGLQRLCLQAAVEKKFGGDRTNGTLFHQKSFKDLLKSVWSGAYMISQVEGIAHSFALQLLGELEGMTNRLDTALKSLQATITGFEREVVQASLDAPQSIQDALLECEQEFSKIGSMDCHSIAYLAHTAAPQLIQTTIKSGIPASNPGVSTVHSHPSSGPALTMRTSLASFLDRITQRLECLVNLLLPASSTSFQKPAASPRTPSTPQSAESPLPSDPASPYPSKTNASDTSKLIFLSPAGTLASQNVIEAHIAAVAGFLLGLRKENIASHTASRILSLCVRLASLHVLRAGTQTSVVMGWIHSVAFMWAENGSEWAGRTFKGMTDRRVVEDAKRAVPKGDEIRYEVYQMLPTIEGALSSIDPIARAFRTKTQQGQGKSDRKRVINFGGAKLARSLDPWTMQEGVSGFSKLPTFDKA